MSADGDADVRSAHNQKNTFFTFSVKKYYLCTKICNMIVSFEKQYLCDLYEKGQSSDKKHRFQPQDTFLTVCNIIDLSNHYN